MGSVNQYQERARRCSERAQTLANGIDRARWLQLAEQWASTQPHASPKGAGAAQ
jgi:hypothetical protein